MSTTDILRRTRTNLTTKTWVNHVPGKLDEVCLLTAIDVRSADDPKSSWDARKALQACIKEKFPSRTDAFGSGIPQFNDHHDTTLDDVLEVVDCAIEKQPT